MPGGLEAGGEWTGFESDCASTRFTDEGCLALVLVALAANHPFSMQRIREAVLNMNLVIGAIGCDFMQLV